jgi:hypothetical protein
VGGNPANAAIDDRRHSLGGAQEHPPQREIAADADNHDNDEGDCQPEEKSFKHVTARITNNE